MAYQCKDMFPGSSSITARVPSPSLPASFHQGETHSAPISNKLTIYSRSGHIVQQYSRGTPRVILPKSAEVDSIVVIGSDGSVIPFSYVPETNMGIALTDRATGAKTDILVIKNGETLTGKVLYLDSNNVVIANSNKITNIREYDRVEVAVSDDNTRPYIIIRQDSDFTLSYLLTKIAWSCVGTALIDDKRNIMYLRLAGNIVNNTESDISAHTTLVSGEVYQQRSSPKNTVAQYGAPRAMLASMAPISSQKVRSSVLEDYTKYDVGSRTIRDKDVAELGSWSFPIIKLYIHQTDEENVVRFGYRFTASEFIPSALVNVYSITQVRTIDSYLGSNEIEESQKGDDIDILLGESTMLQCSSEVIISEVVTDEAMAQEYNLPSSTGGNEKWHITTENVTVSITNHNRKQSTLVLKHYVGKKLLLDTRCQQYKRRKDGFLEWYFEVPARTGENPFKHTFTCQILTASYY